MKIIRKNRSANVVDRISKGLLFAFLMLGFGFTGLQAQNEVLPANFYNLVNGEQTNEITVAPGETFTWIIGMSSEGGMDGVTITSEFDTNLLQEDDEEITDLIGANLIFGVQSEVNNETGYITFTKTAIGTSITGSFDVMELVFTVNEDAPNGTTVLAHELDPAVVLRSNIVYIGNEILADEDAPSLTVNIQGPADCPELGLNIGDACDDGDEMTENDEVTADCECVGTPIDLTPVNDLCSGAIAIACGDSLTGSTVGATPELLGTCGTAQGTGGALWYVYTGDINGIVTASMCESDYDSKLQVYTGACGDLTCVGGDDDAFSDGCGNDPFFNFEAEVGVEYYILVTGFGANEGNFGLKVECAAFDCQELGANIGDACDDGDENTVNDQVNADCGCAGEAPAIGSVCSTAIPVDCNAEPATYSSAAANGTNTTSCSMGNNGLWFSFMGTGGDITVNSTASFDHEMSINSGSCDELVNLGCDDGSVGAETYTILGSVQGEMYYVYIARYSSGSTITGDITIDIDCATPPVCSSPELFLSAQDANGNAIDGCLNSDSEYFVLAALEGGSGNDSYNVSLNGGEPTEVEANGSIVLGPIAAGTDADVVAVGAQDDQCDATASVDSPGICVPANDLCADAIPVVCGETASGSTLGATAATLPFCGTSLTTAPGVWYSLSDFSGIVSVTTCSEGGPEFDTKLGVFSGSCDALVCVGGDDDASNGDTELDCTIADATANRASFVEFEASADETYYIYVTGFSTNVGNFDLNVSCQVIDCESPQLALDAVDVDGAPIEGCLEAGSEYFVQATLSGGSGNASYSVSANGAEPVIVDADGSFTFGPYSVGTDVSVNAVGADSDICEVSASVDSPQICGPANDNCADAEAISCGDSVSGTTLGANNSDFASPSCTGGTPADVFYSLDAVEGTEYTVTVNGDDYDGVLVIYSGSCEAGDQVELGCSDSGFTAGIAETIVFTVDADQTVIIRTYDWSSTQGSFDLSVSCVEPFDCPDLEANIGDACNDGDDNTENDMINENCECEGTPVVTPDCEDFVYYISDHAAADGISDIYEVTLSGGVATMEYIATSDIEIHIAYNNADNLIYAVSKHENSYRTINPHDVAPAFGPTISLGADYGELTAAVFAPNGKLLIGSQDNNAIYSVNVSTNVVSSYDTYAPVTGGDLAFASNGMLYLATRSGNGGLYEAYPADVIADVLIGSVPNLVTGMAITDVDQLLVSAQGNMSLDVYNTDGSNAATSYMLDLDGEPYTLRDGDMTSGCNTFNQPGDGECLNYKLYYVHTPQGGGQEPLLEVTLNGDGTASYNTIMPNLGGHIGLSPDGSIIYNVGGSDLKIVDVASASVLTTIDIISDGGVDLSGIPAALVGNDGTLYIGHSGSNQVYTVNPATGIATPFGPSRTVNGGDLIEVEGEIWLITRNNNTFTNVLTGASFTVPVNEINGAAVLGNGNVLLADGNGGSLLKEVEIASQSVVATYDIALPLFNGDLAGACVESGGLNTQCYGSEILGFEQGLQTNGDAVPLDRSDATAALGQPDASNAAGGFVSLGEGGSITIGFGGVIYDAPGNDIRIWETSFSGDVCGGADDEQADIELSQDGINFVSAGSICRDGEVDIAGTGLDYVAAIRITNSASTGSLDGYDVDGVEAINGCENNPVVENGDCYATEVVEYIEGLKSNNGAIDLNRTNPEEALGAPERSNQSGDLVFVSLGYGGSLTLAFDGAIPNGDGDDIEVVETTWGNNSCNSYDEFADVYVSVSGEPGDWHLVKTICRADNFVDISDAGDGTLGLEYVNFVRIVNNDDMSNTPDAFDVDGVVALYNCEGEVETQGLAANSNSVLSSYPNPTSGPSQVVFMTAETGRTLVEVYDMSGRMITALFNAEAQQGEEYRIDFDGANLPNGIYIYKMTTANETIIDKFMIAK